MKVARSISRCRATVPGQQYGKFLIGDFRLKNAYSSKIGRKERRVGQPRLLLIEDHAELAQVTALILREAGIDVRIAMSGKDALQEAAAWYPEMVLCDLTLPDIHGLEVMETLRELPQTKNSLIAVHSMISEREIRSLEQNTRAGTINLFLSKPLTEEKIERLLTNFAALRERRASSST